MNIETFQMERWQSLHEHGVECNLSESGVHPLTVSELLEDADPDALLSARLGYPQTNGSEELRALVADRYAGATPENVLVTNGSAEANFLACWRLLDRDATAVIVTPIYGQVLGLARALCGRTLECPLAEEDGRYRIDIERLKDLVAPGAHVIAICNPNNPTGARIPADELDQIGRLADRAGATVLSDEIYRGAELDGDETATMWGRAERVIVTSGLSKAYGLPGLRIGFAIASADAIADLWARHDYTTIAPTVLSDRLARTALEPARRARLIERTRRILRDRLPLVSAFAGGTDGVEWIAPEAGAIAWIRYRRGPDSLRLADTLRTEHSTLVVPGAHFGFERHIRVGFGGEEDEVCEGLRRLSAVISA